MSRTVVATVSTLLWILAMEFGGGKTAAADSIPDLSLLLIVDTLDPIYGSQMISAIAAGSHFPNVRVFPDTLWDETEPSVTHNSRAVDELLIGSNTFIPSPVDRSQGYFYSTDGGDSWDGSTKLPQQRADDPSVAYDHDGNAYFTYLEVPPPRTDGNIRNLVVRRSSDGGQTWDDPAPLIVGMTGFPDKEHLVIDTTTSSSYQGNMYAAWTTLGSPYGAIKFSKATTSDWDFWGPDTTISGGLGSTYHQGVNLAVNRDGELFAAWAVYDEDNGSTEDAIAFNKSTDGGETWEGANRVIEIQGIRTDVGVTALPPKLMRVNSFPIVAVGQRELDTTIHLIWTDKRNGDADILMIKSYDGGETWSDTSAPIRVNDDQIANGRDQWFPWASIDQYGGINIVFYDCRNDADNYMTETWIARSTDGGETFHNFRISEVAFEPAPVPGLTVPYIGDYIGITSAGDNVHACWNDNRVEYAGRGVYQLQVASLPIQRMHAGALGANTTWDSVVYMIGEVLVPSGVTLTVSNSADIRVCTNPSNPVRLIVQGALVIDSSGGRPVFNTESNTPGDWAGIRIDSGGSVEWGNGCVVRGADTAIIVANGAECPEIRNVRIEDCGQIGFHLADAVRLVNDTIADTITEFGAYIEDCGVVIDSSVIPTRAIACNVTSGTSTWEETNILTQNVTIDGSATLSIKPGSAVLASNGYALKAYGVLNAVGSTSNRIQFASTASTPGLQDWAGILHYGPGKVTLRNADIRDCYRGVWVVSPSYTDTLIIDSCTFEHGFYAGLQNDGDTLSLVSITATRFADIQNHGIYVYQGRTEVDGCTFRGGMTYGVRFEAGNSRRTKGVIKNCSFDSLTTSTASGVFLSAVKYHTAPYGILQDNTFGDHWLGSTPNNQTAIYIYNCDGALTLQDNRIDGDSSATGFKPAYGVLNYSSPTYLQGNYDNVTPWIDHAKHGVYTMASGSADSVDMIHVRAIKIESGQYGVYLYSNARADLEDQGWSNAFKSFCSSGRFSVYNRNPNYTVPARLNYWGSSSGCSGWPRDSGLVDHSNYLSVDPFGFWAKRAPELVVDDSPTEVMGLGISNYPNPFNASTVIQFSMHDPGHAELIVYNVLGQRVRVLVNQELPVGNHNATWDGTDDRGRVCPSGVYFYRLVSDGRETTKKMVVVK